MLTMPRRKKDCCSSDSQTDVYTKNLVKRQVQKSPTLNSKPVLFGRTSIRPISLCVMPLIAEGTLLLCLTGTKLGVRERGRICISESGGFFKDFLCRNLPTNELLNIRFSEVRIANFDPHIEIRRIRLVGGWYSDFRGADSDNWRGKFVRMLQQILSVWLKEGVTSIRGCRGFAKLYFRTDRYPRGVSIPIILQYDRERNFALPMPNVNTVNLYTRPSHL